MADELNISMLSMKLCRKICSSQVKTDFFELFPVCSGCVSLLFSHPGWGPATAELQTNSYRRNERWPSKKLGSSSISKQNKTTKQQIIYKMALKLSEKVSSWFKNQLYWDLPVCSGCVSLLLSHPGLGPATAELQTNSYSRNERWPSKKTRLKIYLQTKQNNKTTIYIYNGLKIVGKSPSWFKNQLYWDLPVCSGCVSLLLSHPGLGPATAELQTNSHRRNEWWPSKKTRLKFYLQTKQNNKTVNFI